MYVDGKMLIGMGEEAVFLLPEMSNRHGLIAGATGTGKTTTLKVMAESFSDMGIPVFLSDIKGDLASLAIEGKNSAKITERLEKLKLQDFNYKSFPVQFWDIYGENGIPVRTSISSMGPIMLARILGLNDVQSSVLNIIFRIADDCGLLLLDLKDLKSMVQYVGENARKFTLEYGNISAQTIGAIVRSLISLEDQGGNYFFGEPELVLSDWLKRSEDGKGYINILDSRKLFLNPPLYSTFLLWMISELYETMPEVGDTDMPKMIFFFDEAHLLFKETPKILLQKIEQVVRLIRSKGVGIYFITQSPMDLPRDVLNQLGNRVLHALRAYTPAELKTVQGAADSFRQNPNFDTATAITELETGEALVSFLDQKGSPGIVQRTTIIPPQSAFGYLDADARGRLISVSPLKKKYHEPIDRESAYEILTARVAKQEADIIEEDKRKEKLRQWEEK
ncbi:MAG TPA: helicase HerA-like domain-containing protein, partial [Anaerovoracaceae bacterium]|nr:helicase HerA-like domain-containing protein [Anaerovoracaceae bacterium]